jgi:glycine cleavage system H protein
MKEISEMSFPRDLRYSDDHEWAKETGGTVRVGISEYAQDQMGDIVFVELPEPGKHIEGNSEFGVVESVKTVSSMLMPVSGTVIAVNGELDRSPDLVNRSPYDEGWMIDIKPDSPEDVSGLMDTDAYLAFLERGH